MNSAENEPLTFADAQQRVDRWIQDVGIRYFSEMTNLAQLVEEVGELARIVSRTYGEPSFKPGEQPSDLSDELADVLFVVICIANQTGVDLTQAFTANLHKKSHRDQDRHRHNPKLQPPGTPEH